MPQDEKLFGTNGIRGEVNMLLTPDLALKIGRSMGTIVKRRGLHPEIMVGADTRFSGDMLKSAVSAGILSTGCRVVDVGVLATPCIQYGVMNTAASMGAMITASHNPPEYNGLKCIAEDGTETSEEEEKAIEAEYRNEDFFVSKWDGVQAIVPRNDLESMYINGILEQVNRESLAKRAFRVVLDCANGATSSSSPLLMEKLGARLVTLNANPSGSFPAHSSEPTEENLGDIISLLKETDADIGIAHDGDGDRTIFIDEKGNYILGDKSLAIVARHMVRKNHGGLVVTAINTSSILEDVVLEAGGTVHYTPIGSPIVARQMIQRKAVFGGEENGGLIFPDHQYCRDGAMAAASVLEIMAETREELSSLVESLPKYHLVKQKFKYPPKLKESILLEYADSVKDKNPVLLDGVKVVDDSGWVLVRPSGTEAIYRIQVEDKDQERASRKADETRKLLMEIIERQTE